MYRVRLLHLTEFEHDEPVSESYHEVRLQPFDDEYQNCVGFRIRTQPASAPTASRDYFGNWVHRFNVMPKHRRLRIESESVVMTEEPAPDLERAETLAGVDRQRAALLDAHYDFLMPSAHVPAADEVRPLVRAAEDASGGTAAGFARAAAGLVQGGFRVLPHAPRVRASVRDVLAAGAGACQDLAHVMIALARARGLPARYVSGYLAPARARVPGNGADQIIGGRVTHAWAEVFVPGSGWIGIDPTLGAPTSGRYIRVAVGRDHGDVPPVRGVYRGQAGQRLSVDVLLRPTLDDDGCEHLREGAGPQPEDPPAAAPRMPAQQ